MPGTHGSPDTKRSRHLDLNFGLDIQDKFLAKYTHYLDSVGKTYSRAPMASVRNQGTMLVVLACQ